MTENLDAYMSEAMGSAPVVSTPTTAVASPQDIMSILKDKKMQLQIEKALPSFLTPDRFMRVVLTELRKTPALLRCSKESFLGALMQCAQLGLDPTSALGHAYLIPFKQSCQLIIGYKGLLDLARRSGAIQSINVFVVHQKDEFNYALGLNPDIKHVPSMDADPGALTHVYAVVRLKDGGVQFEVMSRAQIEAVRRVSKGADKGPWVSHYEEMAKKTVVRRLFKYLPISIERLEEAISHDERSEMGEVVTYDPDTDEVIESPT